ncbi:MlaA family lipoprotein [Magnetospirillum sulfuroxidans]|uniref:MlaA family lipoprotein n=1 Tax=Magnetospirillum sulfuroxidans TaxID=611300 RepID=UPI003D160BD1
MKHSSIAARLAASLIAVALVAGCATPPPADDKEAMADWTQTNDPLEPMNRAIFDFNLAIDKAVLKPVAQGYRWAMPQYGKDRVRDFLRNLRAPVVFVNDVLQGEPDRAMQTLMRFAFNTGFGIGGLIDVAEPGGIPYHDEDFGQTFAVWGIGEGPYLVLPILGPSNPRDGVGIATEWLVDPFNLYMDHIDRSWPVWTRAGVSGLEKRERLLDTLDEIERSSLDYYSALRSTYRQNRNAEVKNSLNPTGIR